MENKIITHPLKPIFDKNSAVLILGTMPSPKSRENNFYYGHPQNRFWHLVKSKVLRIAQSRTLYRMIYRLFSKAVI